MIEIIHLQNFNFLWISLDISFTVHSSRAINPTPIDITQESFLPLAKWIGVSVALQSRVRVLRHVRRLVRAWHFRCCQPLSLPLFPLFLLFYTGHLALSHTAAQLKVVANPIQSTLRTIEDWFPRGGWGAH